MDRYCCLILSVLAYIALMRIGLLFFSFILALGQLNAQSYRGLAPLNDTVCWVSGSKGTVVKTVDGGAHWDTVSPIGYSTKEFRDIHVYSPNHALVMSSGDSAVILRTRDGGETWDLVHSNNRPGVFYDAMDAFGPFICVIGDPYKDRTTNKWVFDMLMSCDSGSYWNCSLVKNWKGYWEADSSEAFYAASGTNIILGYKGDYYSETFEPKNLRFSMVSGGGNSRLYMNGIRIGLNFPHGKSTGPYGHASASGKRMVIVGGDYTKPDAKEDNCLYYDTKTYLYQKPQIAPNGYRSGVASFNNGQMWVCTGTNGTDFSLDDGKNWRATDLAGYNACAFSSNYLWLCGDKGAVIRVPALSIVK